MIITDGTNTWKVAYKYVKKIAISYQQELMWQCTRWEKAIGFDDWGYDEFFAVDEETLSHEILFASDTSILIHFKNNNIFISKIR